jgi:serine/threonine-protein kinase
VVKLLKRCLEKDPRARLRDIGEARIVLENIERGVESDDLAATGASAAPAASKRAWLPWTIAALAVASAIASITFSQRGSAPPTETPLTQLSLVLPPNSSLALRGQNPAPPAISPDGRRTPASAWQRPPSCARHQPMPSSCRDRRRRLSLLVAR